MASSSTLYIASNARLARELEYDFAKSRINSGEVAWRRPTCFSMAEWFYNLRSEYFQLAPDSRVPIDGSQSYLIWQSIIDRDIFIGEPKITSLAIRTWRTIFENDIQPPVLWTDKYLSDDCRRFAEWAYRYNLMCVEKGVVDEWGFYSEIPDHIAEGIFEIPKQIELVGFEHSVPPLLKRVLGAFEQLGTIVIVTKSKTSTSIPQEIMEFADDSAEIMQAAKWARNEIEMKGNSNIALIIGDLDRRLDEIERVLRKVFDPEGFRLSGSNPKLWHIALGSSLANWPIVAEALNMLQLSHTAWTHSATRVMLRSPYLRGWGSQKELQSLAITDSSILSSYRLTLNEILWTLKKSDCSLMVDALEDWLTIRHSAPAKGWPSDWARVFQTELGALGFGLGRPLNSLEYQALDRWNRLLEEFGSCDAVATKRINRVEALNHLLERAHSLIFREQNAGVPLQVMTPLEAIGSSFDGIWILGLDNASWPPSAKKDPFIPLSLQTNLDFATAENCLQKSETIFASLFSASRDIKCSFVGGNREERMTPTSLLENLEVVYKPADFSIEKAPMEEPFFDVYGSALSSNAQLGGMKLLEDQAACAFKAFAKWRLKADEIDIPRPGLSAAQRGTLVHDSLEAFWKELHGKRALDELSEVELKDKVDSSVDWALDRISRKRRLIMSDGMRSLERLRLQRQLRQWIEHEKTRDDFEVKDRESAIIFQYGEVNLRGTIDRVDCLSDGTLMLIDYKTGSARFSEWEPSVRIRSPQLPGYAVSMLEPPSTIAFAMVRPEYVGFSGLTNMAEIQGVVKLEDAGPNFSGRSWEELLKEWRSDLEEIFGDFAHGKAAVSPRNLIECDRCHLHSLCRIGQRLPSSLADEDAS